MSGRQTGEVPPPVGNSVAFEIDLVSESEDDEENVKVISATIVRPSVPLDCPPQQENRRSGKVTSDPVQVASPVVPTLLATAATATSTNGCPPKVVKWSQCLVCNKGFLAMCRQAEEETKKTQQQVSYLLEQCMGVPPRKCKKVAKKILRESEIEGRAPVSLYCTTHELMVLEANALAGKVVKLLEVLEEKEKELRSVAETWISGTEPVEGMGLIVRNAVMRANQKNKGAEKEKPVEVKPSVPEAAKAPETVTSVPGNDINKTPESSPSVTKSSNDRRKGSSEVKVNAAEVKPPVTAVRDSFKSKVADDKGRLQDQASQQSRGRPTADTNKNSRNSEDVVMLSEDSDDDDDSDSTTNSATHSGSTRFPTSANNSSRIHAKRDSRHEASGRAKTSNAFPWPHNHNDNRLQRSVVNYSCLHSLSSFRGGNKECPVCAEQFYTAKERNYHYRSYHSDGIHYTCFICKHLYSTFNNLQTHLDNLHDPAKPFECGKCGIRFGTKVRLQAHIQTHIRNARFYNNNPVIRGRTQFSRSSNTSFTSRNYRNYHHQQPSKFQTCPYCKKTVADNRSLRLHMEVVHGSKCDRCGFTCDSEQKLNQHILRYHLEADRPPRSGNPRNSTQRSRGDEGKDNRKGKQKEKIYYHDCDSCGIDFDTRVELMRHKKDCRNFAYL